MQRLEPRVRQVIELCVLQEMTLREVGLKFGISKERVRQIKATGLAQLADMNGVDFPDSVKRLQTSRTAARARHYQKHKTTKAG